MRENNKTGTIIAAFAAVYIIWGSTYIAIRFAVEVLPPFLMLATRFLIAGGAVYLWERGRSKPRPTLTNWRASGLLGALLLVGGTGVASWSEQRLASGLTSLLMATVPIWVVILDWWRPGGVRPTLGMGAGLVVGFGGVALLLSQGNSNGAIFDLVAALAVSGAALSWSLGTVYARQAKVVGAPFLASAMQMLSGGAILLVLGTLTGEWSKLHLENLTWKASLSLLYLIVFGSLVAFTAFVWLAGKVSPSLVATYAYVNPVVAVALGWLLGNEALNLTTLLASACVIAGVVLVTVFRNSPAPEPKSDYAHLQKQVTNRPAIISPAFNDPE